MDNYEPQAIFAFDLNTVIYANKATTGEVNMFDWILYAILALFFCYRSVEYYLENGYYFPISRKYGARRYLFPKDEATIRKLNSECRHVCGEVLNGNILKYPFLEENASSLAFSKRILTVFYERKDSSQTPVAFHAPFVFTWEKQCIFHCGLMMVAPKHQKQGLQSLTLWSVFFYFFYHGIDILTDITGFAGGASFLTIQERSQRDTYPIWRQPELPPKQWQLDVTRFLLANYRSEFGTSKMATLDETALVVNNSFGEEGDPGWHLLSTVDVNKQKSSNVDKQQFMRKRLNNDKQCEQWFVGRPDVKKFLWNALGFKS